MRRRRLVGTLSALLLLGASGALGQEAPVGLSGIQADVARARELRGDVAPRSSLLRRFSETGRMLPSGDAVWLRALPVQLASTNNSGWADDRDNGAEWAGRGSAGLVRFGVEGRWRWFSAALVPEAAGWQNQPFAVRERARETVGGPYPNAFYRLDLPQRLGGDGGSTIGMGQSYVRADVGPASAGFSNENLWSGPASRYPILLGNTAPGFPHVFLGTNAPVDVWIARIDARAIVGWTEESAGFDTVAGNDFSNLFGWGVSVRPRGLSFLEVGVQRTLHYEVDGQFDADMDQLIGFLMPSEAHRVGDELASMWFRALLPDDEIEFYGEWARTDRFATWFDDFIPEIDHSQGYLLGARKLVDLGHERRLMILGETVDLQEQSELRAGAGRPLPTFYTNSQQGRGHTHQGQILGASIGPAADAQYLGVDYLDADANLVGLFVERVRRNDATHTRKGVPYAAREAFPFRHDVELTGGVRGAVWLGDISVGGSASYTHRYNRVYITPEDSNVRVTLDLRWLPGGRAPRD